MYSTDSFPAFRSNEPASFTSEQVSFLGKDQPWAQLATSAMTSMVVSLDMIELVRELLVAENFSWDVQNYSALLSALEAMHWHAFCFNENSHLRLQLQQRGFMNKNRSGQNLSPELPHLLEQEILSMEQLLFTVFRLFCHEKHKSVNTTGSHSSLDPRSTNVMHRYTTKEVDAFAEPLVERY